ncbi:MAG: diaminopimelate decarboxylase [Hyphomonadaceae bacterium]|nr:diaminopimelate decarboxylase [Clostridia bacterium]
MFISECLKLNEQNHLEIGGCDTLALAAEYGTPLYVMDEGLIKKYAKIYTDAITKYYHGNGMILYASKAFCTVYMAKLIKACGLGLDVVSGGELYTALKADFPTDKIYFHGNNKTMEELKLAIDNRVGRIVVDNLFELDMLDALAQEAGIVQDILFRIKPGIDAHTHDFVMTGQIDSKFGVALETGEAFNIIAYANKLLNVKVVGVHCHIGSQIFDLAPFTEAARVMMHFIGDLKDKLNLEIEELNLGGGFGIKYIDEHDPVAYDCYIASVSEVVKNEAILRGVKLPKILMEPGRSIVAPAGITLYTVGAVKEIPSIRKYVSVDGGMCDNPRYMMYQSPYDAVLANKANAPKTELVTIAGKCCESGDLIQKDILMPKIAVGDTLAVLATGAYNYSMSSNYNRIPRPAVVMVENGQSKVIVKRESYEDILKNDL